MLTRKRWLPSQACKLVTVLLNSGQHVLKGVRTAFSNPFCIGAFFSGWVAKKGKANGEKKWIDDEQIAVMSFGKHGEQRTPIPKLRELNWKLRMRSAPAWSAHYMLGYMYIGAREFYQQAHAAGNRHTAIQQDGCTRSVLPQSPHLDDITVSSTFECGVYCACADRVFTLIHP